MMFGKLAGFGRRGGLRHIILVLLKRGPRSGSELMDKLEDLSWGYWRPSPGSIYPALKELASEGIITKKEDGKYELTKKGADEIGWMSGTDMSRPTSTTEVLKEMQGYAAYLEDVAREDPSEIKENKRDIIELIKELEILLKTKK
jgi:DNA-binding PadR family transcriptional regulator